MANRMGGSNTFCEPVIELRRETEEDIIIPYKVDNVFATKKLIYLLP